METPTYTTTLIELLNKLVETQADTMDRVAAKTANCLAAGGMVHLFGSGHSVIPTLDAFPRYGSFVGLHPLTDPRLMWHNVLGPGGVRELLWLERVDGYVQHFLEHEPVNPGDTIVVYSHSGRNAAPLNAAEFGKAHGLFTVAVTSIANRPQSGAGRHLSDIADETIDTGVPVEDAVVHVDGWSRPVGGTSTVVASVVSHELITRTARALAKKGIVLPTFVSPTVPGASIESNDDVFAAHRKRLAAAESRRVEQQ